MKKILLCILIFNIFLLTGCGPTKTPTTTPVEKEEVNLDTLTDFESLRNVSVEEKIIAEASDEELVDEIYFKKSNFKYEENTFKGDSTITCGEDVYDQYYDDSIIYKVVGKDITETNTYIYPSVFDFLGLSTLISRATDLEVVNTKVTGNINDSELLNVFTMLILDLSSTKTVTDFTLGNELNFTVVLSDDFTKINRVELNFKPVYDVIDSSYDLVNKIYSFEYDNCADIREVPVIEDLETVFDNLGTIDNPLSKSAPVSDTLDMYTIEMIQMYGDAIYFKSGDFDMLVDAGQSSDGLNVKKHLAEYVTDGKLELVIATHAHSDHIGGMTTAVSGLKIDMVLDYGYTRTSSNSSIAYEAYMNRVAGKVCGAKDAVNNNAGCTKRIYVTNDMYIDVLNTGDYVNTDVDFDGDHNESSVAIILTYKNISYYLAGDLESSGESYMAYNNELKDVTVMKASHHGSKNANSTTLLNKILPEIVIISTAIGSGGDQMHPTSEAINRFKSVRSNPKIYCNFVNGTIKLTTDGTYVPIMSGSPTIKGYSIGGTKITGEETTLFTNSRWYQQYR